MYDGRSDKQSTMYIFFTFLVTFNYTGIPLLCDIVPATVPPLPKFLRSFYIEFMSFRVLCYQPSCHNCFQPAISSLSLWLLRLCFSARNRLQIFNVRSVHYYWSPRLHPTAAPVYRVTILSDTHAYPVNTEECHQVVHISNRPKCCSLTVLYNKN